MDWIVSGLRHHPELAIFLTLALGFLLGRLRIGSFTLGNVVGTLLAGDDGAQVLYLGWLPVPAIGEAMANRLPSARVRCGLTPSATHPPTALPMAPAAPSIIQSAPRAATRASRSVHRPGRSGTRSRRGSDLSNLNLGGSRTRQSAGARVLANAATVERFLRAA